MKYKFLLNIFGVNSFFYRPSVGFIKVKTQILLSFAICMSLSNETLLAQKCSPTQLVSWEVDACQAFSGSSSYAEFSPTYSNTSGCSTPVASNLFRNSGNHSCNTGRPGGDGYGICIGNYSNNNYQANSTYAVRFTVNFGAGDKGTISALNFWQMAPSPVYQIGISNPIGNNYPTKYGVRVLRDGVEIYRQINLATSTNWAHESIDFSSDPDFIFNGSADFEFELYAYAPTGNGYNHSMWELDELSIEGCCDQCDNLTDAGLIGSDQAQCGGFDPVVLTNVSLPSGGGGSPIEYQWKKQIAGIAGWTDIAGATQATYDPPFTTQKTYYQRKARRTACSDYVFSNTITIDPQSAPGASATGGLITCVVYPTLHGSSPTPGVHYSWTGPNGFTSTQQNPVAFFPGTYTLTVTDPATGCTSTAVAGVLESKNIPHASATGGSISCNQPAIQLMGSSVPMGVNFDWTGPNGFMSSLQNPVVSDTGTYRLVVTDTLNGCADTAYAQVHGNASPPGAMASGGTLTCTSTSVQLMGSSPTAGVTYSWSGPAGFSSALQNPTATVGGVYTLTVTNPATGCTSTDTANVAEDVNLPGAMASGGTLTCTSTSVQLMGSSPTAGVTYSWSGPAGFSSALQNPTATVGGVYTLTVTNPATGCTSTDTANVAEDVNLPGAMASGGTLTCTSTSVQLMGSSPTAGVTYSWSGPAGFSSALQNPTATVAGVYTLTVTNPATGCTSTDTANVAEDVNLPGAMASGGTLTCTSTSVQLMGSSSTAGVTYSWSGPAGFSSALQNPAATVGGVYTLTVTNPATGCTSTDTANVAEDVNLPGAMASGGTLTCTSTSVQLMGSSPTAGVTYSWSGPAGFSSALQNPTATVGGVYTLTVTNPATGCTSTDTANVAEDVNLPGAMASGGTLTCTSTSIQLMGSSPTAGVTYSWSGPAGFSSALQNPAATVAGVYTLTVTNPATGCTSTDTANVAEDVNLPGAMASGGTLTCTSTSVQLMGSSPTAGVTYSWSGPAGFSSALQNPTATVAGVYTLIVTNPATGCTSTDTANVAEDVNLPGAMASGGTLTCTSTSVQLMGSSPTAGVTYSWSGPAGFSSALQNPTATVAGVYTLTVTNPATGCTSTDTANVAEDVNLPGAMASGGTLTCTSTSVQLMGSSPTAGVTYSWSGPAGFSSALQNPTATVAGVYTLTVTNPATGCTSTDTANVAEDVNLPGCLWRVAER